MSHPPSKRPGASPSPVFGMASCDLVSSVALLLQTAGSGGADFVFVARSAVVVDDWAGAEGGIGPFVSRPARASSAMVPADRARFGSEGSEADTAPESSPHACSPEGLRDQQSCFAELDPTRDDASAPKWGTCPYEG